MNVIPTSNAKRTATIPLTMAIPRMSQLRPGLDVNIVLKTDQPTGKLTAGKISRFLTRGDHPRGIKVALTDGRIGRVQSMASNSDSNGSTATDATSAQGDTRQFSQIQLGRGTRRIQDDYRLDPEPAETSSLLDYVKAPKQKKGKGGRELRQEDAITPQQQLEAEFSKVDSALVAAILSDHENNLSAARATLSSLS
jgi:uncharacterized repeat protein (TIGR03833 family)